MTQESDEIERQIKKLKSSARRKYLAYQHEVGNFNCGAQLAEYFSPGATLLKNEFNAIMDELAKLDPLTPSTRL